MVQHCRRFWVSWISTLMGCAERLTWQFRSIGTVLSRGSKCSQSSSSPFGVSCFDHLSFSHDRDDCVGLEAASILILAPSTCCIVSLVEKYSIVAIVRMVSVGNAVQETPIFETMFPFAERFVSGEIAARSCDFALLARWCGSFESIMCRVCNVHEPKPIAEAVLSMLRIWTAHLDGRQIMETCFIGASRDG